MIRPGSCNEWETAPTESPLLPDLRTREWAEQEWREGDTAQDNLNACWETTWFNRRVFETRRTFELFPTVSWGWRLFFLIYWWSLNMTQSSGPHYMRCMGERQHPGSLSSAKQVLHKLDGSFLKPCYCQDHALATLRFPKRNLSKPIDSRCQMENRTVAFLLPKKTTGNLL